MQRTYTDRRPVETKPFWMTSEFLVMAAMTISLFIASAVVDDLDSRLAWILGVSLVGVYVLSRGIAKAGSPSRSYDPREHIGPSDGTRDAPVREPDYRRTTTPTV